MTAAPLHLVAQTMTEAAATTKAPERIRWAVDLLTVRPSDHVLEIGCGPGHAIALVCERLTTGTITAIDRSATQIARAGERSRECVAAGRARIERIALADFDPGRRRFDKILAVNVNVFWTSPAAALGDVRRLLRPGGTLHLVYEPPAAARLRQLRESIPRLLREHAFDVDNVLERAFRASHGLCIIGRPV
jgi:cyclopropane fatty-acyl-phospholipid synthase-like methyltransferase